MIIILYNVGALLYIYYYIIQFYRKWLIISFFILMIQLHNVYNIYIGIYRHIYIGHRIMKYGIPFNLATKWKE